MSRIRVLVVEDSMTVRRRIVETLQADGDLEVIGEAGDGKTAIEMCAQLRPDVVTLDMMLPVMTGLAATEYIMAHCPTPILIVSASTNRGELFRTYDALYAGAVDVLEKPTGLEAAGDWERRLVASTKLVARIKVITHLRGKLGSGRTRQPGASGAAPASPSGSEVVAIGASTGGPAALMEIVHGLSAEFPAPVLVVLHLNAPFAGALADWLDGLSPLRVTYARDGDALPSPGQGRIILAPPDRHLTLEAGLLRLSDAPERHSCKPSIDVLFESLAREAGPRCTACLLTGMGRDGAAGLLAIRNAGGATIAQNEETSVVFGMPKEAIALGAAQRVLPVGEIASALMALCTRAP